LSRLSLVASYAPIGYYAAAGGIWHWGCSRGYMWSCASVCLCMHLLVRFPQLYLLNA